MEQLIDNWIRGKARLSSYDGEIYLTRKDKRIADREHKRPKGKGRPNENSYLH